MYLLLGQWNLILRQQHTVVCERRDGVKERRESGAVSRNVWEQSWWESLLSWLSCQVSCRELFWLLSVFLLPVECSFLQEANLSVCEPIVIPAEPQALGEESSVDIEDSREGRAFHSCWVFVASAFFACILSWLCNEFSFWPRAL